MNRLFLVLLSFVVLSTAGKGQINERGVSDVDEKAPPIIGKTYCIISGISRYQFIDSLQFADNDALAMRRFMMSKSGGDVDSADILIFLNESATAASVWIQSLKWIKEKNLQPGDRLLVYFSGHGDAVSPEEFYYLANDCDPGNDKDNYAIGGTIPLDKLKNRFKNLTNEGVTVVFIMDACRTNELPGGNSGITSLTEGILNKRTGELSLLATGPGSVSIESREYGGGHGLFTYILLEGLYGYADQNKDGTVTFRELEKYVKTRVEEAAEKKSVVQIPEFCCPDKYTLPLFHVNQDGLLTYEAQKKKKNNLKEEYVFAQRGITTKKSKDTSVLALYSNFQVQLKAGNLNGPGSAEDFLIRLEERLASDPLLEKAKMDYAIALLDAAQESVNNGIRGDQYVYKSIFPNRLLATELQSADAWVPQSKADTLNGKKFIHSEWAMNKALNLIEEDYLPTQIKTRQLFLKVMAEDPGPQKDSMIRKLVNETYSADSGSAFFYHTLGIWQSKKGETDSALNLFAMAEKEAPQSAVYKTSSGLILWRQGDINGAKAKFEEAIAVQPENEQTRFLLSSFYYQNGEKEKAAALLDYSFKSLKLLELAAFQKGIIAHNNGQYDQAKGYYKRALSYNSVNPDYFFYLALAYDHQKAYAEAEHYYKWSLKIDPTYLESHINLGALYIQVGSLDLAFKHLDYAFSRDPKNFKTMNNLGMYYIQKGNLDAAEKFLLASVEAAPEKYNTRVIKNLVTLYYLRKDNLQAEAWFKKLK